MITQQLSRRKCFWTRLTVGLVVSTGVILALSLFSERRFIELEDHGLFLFLQLLVALILLGILVMGVTLTGASLRWFTGWLLQRQPRPEWRYAWAEGFVVGIIAVGAWLVWAPWETYSHPMGKAQVQIRYASRLESPLGISRSSDIFVPVIVTYTDTQGHTIAQRGVEEEPDSATTGRCGREVRWNTVGPTRAVVTLADTGIQLFFPEPIEWPNSPTQQAVEAYLGGQPLSAVKHLCHRFSDNDD